MIDPDGADLIAPFRMYCDTTTSPGGWTLVFVGRGKAWQPRFTTLLFRADFARDDITKGTKVDAEYFVSKDWPAYTYVFYERWLPDSLTGRSYAAPGWLERQPARISPTPTNVNFFYVC